MSINFGPKWEKIVCTLLSREREVGGATETFGRKDESVNKYILEWQAENHQGNDIKLKTNGLYLLVE